MNSSATTRGSVPGPAPQADPAAAKRALRATLLAARRALPATTRTDAELATTQRLLAQPELTDARTVAAYVSVGSEPGTEHLIAALLERGVRVLLPVLRDDNDLDWAEHRSPDDLAPAGRGLREPTTPALGPDAITAADVVIVPGVAVDAAGHRMGRGGGSYDRALARLRPETLTVLLLHAGETDQPVPVEPHDRAVDAAVTSELVLRF